MDPETEKKLSEILDRLPESGQTKYRGMTYEQGIEELCLYLLGDISPDEFPYAES